MIVSLCRNNHQGFLNIYTELLLQFSRDYRRSSCTIDCVPGMGSMQKTQSGVQSRTSEVLWIDFAEMRCSLWESRATS